MGYGNYGYGFGNMMGGGLFGGILMLVFGALVVAGVVLLAVWLVRTASGSGHGAGGTATPVGTAGHDEAVAIARRRLASGEIDGEQFDAIMASLGR